MLHAKIIVPLRFSEWIANLVPVRKKNGEIRMCVDFINLNQSLLKDNYPLPKMDSILQRVVGETCISMMGNFSGYKHIALHREDMLNISFTTPWETFMYQKMPFGLMNAGATFQRAMDITFVDRKNNFIVIYLDVMIIFSQYGELHLKCIELAFHKCRGMVCH